MSQQTELPTTTTGNTSFLRTCFNGINALSGIGLITIPYTLSRVGWLGLCLLLLMATVFCYTGLLIKRCLDSNSLIKTYTDMGFYAFGDRGRMLISTLTYIELYLVPTGFLVLEGDNLHKLFPQVGFKIGGHHAGGSQVFTIIAALVVLPSMWFKNLSWLSYMSAGGVLSYVLIVGSILWSGAEGVGFSAEGKLFDFTGIPTALSLYAFCFGAHPVFPTIYSSMKDKHKFFLVLMVMFGVSTLSYITIGVIGYLMFGQKLLPEVTLNLPTKKISSKIAIYTVLVGPLTKYALIITPLAEAIETSLPYKYQNRLICILTRTLLLISTTVVAVAFPYFGILMALVGAALIVSVSIIIPSLCYLKISNAWKRWSFELVMIVCIIFLAVVVAVFGTYASLRDAIKHH